MRGEKEFTGTLVSYDEFISTNIPSFSFQFYRSFADLLTSFALDLVLNDVTELYVLHKAGIRAYCPNYWNQIDTDLFVPLAMLD